MWGRVTLGRGCRARRGGGGVHTLPQSRASWASKHGSPTGTVPRAMQGRAHGRHAVHTRHGSQPQGSPSQAGTRGSRGESPHRPLCWAPKSHTVPSSRCPSTADFVNCPVFILFIHCFGHAGSLLLGGFPWLHRVGTTLLLRLTGSRAPAEGAWCMAEEPAGAAGALPLSPASLPALETASASLCWGPWLASFERTDDLTSRNAEC